MFNSLLSGSILSFVILPFFLLDPLPNYIPLFLYSFSHSFFAYISSFSLSTLSCFPSLFSAQFSPSLLNSCLHLSSLFYALFSPLSSVLSFIFSAYSLHNYLPLSSIHFFIFPPYCLLYLIPLFFHFPCSHPYSLLNTLPLYSIFPSFSLLCLILPSLSFTLSFILSAYSLINSLPLSSIHFFISSLPPSVRQSVFLPGQHGAVTDRLLAGLSHSDTARISPPTMALSN